MTSKMSTKIINKSTWGALWATWDPYTPKKDVQTPQGTKTEVQGPLWGTILITVGYYFQCFPIIFTTAFQLCRTIFAFMPTLASPATTQTPTNPKGAGGRGDAFRSAALGLPRCRACSEHPFKIYQTLSENLSLQQPRPFRRADPIRPRCHSILSQNRPTSRPKSLPTFA